MDQRLRPVERLQTSAEYERVFRRGERFFTPVLRIHYAPNNREFSRLGLVVGRKVGKAHVRSRIKRLLREVYRKRKHDLPGTFDVILVPRAEPADYHRYAEAFDHFIRHLQRKGAKDRGRSRERRRMKRAGAAASGGRRA